MSRLRRQELNPLFHRRTKDEDDNQLNAALIKKARSTGVLNMHNMGLVSGKLNRSICKQIWIRGFFGIKGIHMQMTFNKIRVNPNTRPRKNMRQMTSKYTGYSICSYVPHHFLQTIAIEHRSHHHYPNSHSAGIYMNGGRVFHFCWVVIWLWNDDEQSDEHSASHSAQIHQSLDKEVPKTDTNAASTCDGSVRNGRSACAWAAEEADSSEKEDCSTNNKKTAKSCCRRAALQCKYGAIISIRSNHMAE